MMMLRKRTTIVLLLPGLALLVALGARGIHWRGAPEAQSSNSRPAGSDPSVNLGAVNLMAPSSEDAREAVMPLGAHSEDGMATLTSEADPAWEHARGDAYDTVLGAGFSEHRFVDSWGRFGPDGLHRPDLEGPEMPGPGRPLTAQERDEANAILDAHEGRIRESAISAYNALRSALEAQWSSGYFERFRAGTLDADELLAQSEQIVETSQQLGRYCYVDSFTTGGWCLRFTVHSLDFPVFDATFAELERAVEAREADVHAYLAAL